MTSAPDDHRVFQTLLQESPLNDSVSCELGLFGLLAASSEDFEHSGRIIGSREAAQFYKGLENPNIPSKIGRDAFSLDLPMWDQKNHAFHH
ncbi:hypothetical protein V8C35DRAFT_285435 [Trichoderma chlorosporum]